MLAERTLMVMYGQVTVMAIGSDVAGLQWSDDEGAQGFAWMPTLVSFGVRDHDGGCLLSVDIAEADGLAPDALWAIRVPFEVPDGGVDIGTILDTRPVLVPAGRYGLVFQALPGGQRDDETLAFRFRLTFGPPREPAYAILRRGSELSTDVVLRERSAPA